MKIYNKLVKDKIPQIINSKGDTCLTRTLNDDEYINALNEKLEEELKEYLESGDIEELADLEEVLRAILDFKQVAHETFEKIRIEKVNKRGAFKERLFLISTN